STQVKVVAQVVQILVVNDEPVEMPTHQFPVVGSRPAMSVMPSPLKSPVTTFCHFTAGFQVAQSELLNQDEPFDNPTNHCPVLHIRPMMAFPKVAPTVTLAVAVSEEVIMSVTVTDCRPADLRVMVNV